MIEYAVSEVGEC